MKEKSYGRSFVFLVALSLNIVIPVKDSLFINLRLLTDLTSDAFNNLYREVNTSSWLNVWFSTCAFLGAPGSSPGRGYCVVFLGKTLNSHSASLHPGVYRDYFMENASVRFLFTSWVVSENERVSAANEWVFWYVSTSE